MAVLICIIHDERVEWYEALILVLLYIVYIAVMYFDKTIQKWARGNKIIVVAVHICQSIVKNRYLFFDESDARYALLILLFIFICYYIIFCWLETYIIIFLFI